MSISCSKMNFGHQKQQKEQRRRRKNPLAQIQAHPPTHPGKKYPRSGGIPHFDEECRHMAIKVSSYIAPPLKGYEVMDFVVVYFYYLY